ncbi:unnamed protein product, partial [Aphanomyces euteiches]
HRQQTLQKDTTGHRDIEEALRKAKCKLAVEVKSTNEKYDQDMLAISSDIDNMQDAYSREQKEVRELSEHFVKMKSKRVLKRKNIVGGNSRRGMQSSAQIA